MADAANLISPMTAREMLYARHADVSIAAQMNEPACGLRGRRNVTLRSGVSVGNPI